jgi:hypothetical protein
LISQGTEPLIRARSAGAVVFRPAIHARARDCKDAFSDYWLCQAPLSACVGGAACRMSQIASPPSAITTARSAPDPIMGRPPARPRQRVGQCPGPGQQIWPQRSPASPRCRNRSADPATTTRPHHRRTPTGALGRCHARNPNDHPEDQLTASSTMIDR